MAEGGSYDSAGNEIVELEVMREDSFSWHPCQVSLCSRGTGLVVVYGNNTFEEIMTDNQEILARIRVRSTPLQGDDCSSIKQGEHVLAAQSSHVKGVFYDAQVEEAIRVRHSKRIHCRCSFRIKWLHQALKEEEALTVPSVAILKLATKSIHLHPTISTFFSMLESSNGTLDAMPRSMTVGGMNLEMDINALLEKQIKEISNSTDISQKKSTQVDIKGPSHGRIVDASLNDPHDTFPLPNGLKGSNGGDNKQLKERTRQIPPVCIPSIEEFTESKLFLSPLAARAALASLRSEFPQSSELSAENNGCSFSTVDRSSYTQGFSLDLSATLEGNIPQFESMKTLFHSSSAHQIVDMSSGAKVNQMDKKKKNGEQKITRPSQSRFTRAQAQKTNGIHETCQMTYSNETQLRLTKTRRVTRSAVEGAEKFEIEDYIAAATNNVHAEFPEFDTSSPKNVTSPVNGVTSKCSDKDDKVLLGKDAVAIKADGHKGTFIQDAEKQNYPKRMTRSAAREGTGTNNVEPKLKLRKRSVSESDDNRLEPEKSLTSPLASKASEQFTEERVKNRKTSTHVNGTPKISERGVGSRTRQKSASSKKLDTQSSERLAFLPRTRSQSKA